MVDYRTLKLAELDMTRQKQESIAVRLDKLLHMRLKVVAKAEGRDLKVVVERVLMDYFQKTHPNVISEITHVPETPAPAVEPTKPGPPKQAKPPRKPRELPM